MDETQGSEGRTKEMMQIQVDIVIIAKTCPECGVNYGMDQALYERRARDGGDFYCTNGHLLHVREPEVEKLRKQLASAQGNLDFYQGLSRQRAETIMQLGNQVRAQKAAKTRLKRRITNGVCPCCKRHFVNVQHHMQTKHPDQIVSAQQAVEKGAE
jgi:hypothetical protein